VNANWERQTNDTVEKKGRKRARGTCELEIRRGGRGNMVKSRKCVREKRTLIACEKSTKRMWERGVSKSSRNEEMRKKRSQVLSCFATSA